MARASSFPLRTVAWALYRMSRPSQLLLVAAVYATGAAMAVARGADPAATDLLVGLGAVVSVAASVHYANEYADHRTDALTTRTPFSGGSGALPRTGLPRGLALHAAAVAFLVGATLAIGCLLHGFPVPAVAVLLVGAVGGWQYSVGPLRLAWRGLGELDNAALGGLVLPAYGYAVLAGGVDAYVLWACLPFAVVVFLNLLDTTWPDRDADAAVGKRTLATRWPPARLRVAYLLGAIVAVSSLAALAGRVLPPVVALAGLSAAPFLAWGATRYARTRSPFPTVAAMVLMAVAQLGAWAWVALR